jgi:hypothetical protein
MLLRSVCIAIVLLLAVPVLAQPFDGGKSLIGTVTDSPDKAKLNQQVTFAGLSTSHPVVIYPSGYDYKMTTVFENEDLIVLQFIADITGSTDTIYIEKKAHRFLIVTVGALEGVVENKPLPVKTHRGVIK